MEIEFTIEGSPMGKERPKFARRGKFTKTYTPKKTREYEDKVKIEYNKSFRGVSFGNKPIVVNIVGIFSVPKSTSKKKTKELIGQPFDKKPDSDNMGKIVLDPLNNLAFDDDKQVTDLEVIKRYGYNPRVEVNIKNVHDRSALVYYSKPATSPIHYL